MVTSLIGAVSKSVARLGSMENARKLRNGGSPGALREDASVGVMACEDADAATATTAASGSGIGGFALFDLSSGAGFECLTGAVADLIGLRAGVAIIAPLIGWT